MYYTIFLLVLWVVIYIFSKRWPQILTPGIIIMFVLNGVVVIYAEIKMKEKANRLDGKDSKEQHLPQQPMLMLMYVFIILIYNTNFVMTQYILPVIALTFSYFSLAIFYNSYTNVQVIKYFVINVIGMGVYLFGNWCTFERSL